MKQNRYFLNQAFPYSVFTTTRLAERFRQSLCHGLQDWSQDIPGGRARQGQGED